MTPFAQWFVLAVVLFLFGVVAVNFWLMLTAIAILGLQFFYYGWKLINF